MKIRNSFVANSSSSSFIIAVKNLEVPELDNVPKWMINLTKKIMKDLANGDVFLTLDQLNDHFVDNYGLESIEELENESEYVQVLYDECVDALTNGFIVCDVSVDDGDEGRINFFSSLSKKDDSGMYLIRNCC